MAKESMKWCDLRVGIEDFGYPLGQWQKGEWNDSSKKVYEMVRFEGGN